MSIIAQQQVPTVAQLATAIGRNLRDLGSGWVEGEIQKPKSYPSGHTYFTLADGQSSLDVVVWPEDGQRLGGKVEEGALVQTHFKRVGFNPKTSRVSLQVDRLRLTGIGELLRRRAEVLAQLQAEGLTDPARRKPLPAFPRRVGVIAPHDSDSKVDVIEALRERLPPQEVIFLPAYVEGVRAVDSIIAALAHLQQQPAIDVIVLARGGGGPRELMPFDDLAVCKAIFACAAPVVTSIAHTNQRPNCDHVAAACAHVPRVAAELVVPGASELTAELDRLSERLAETPARIGERGAALVELWRRARITERFERHTLELGTLRMRLGQAVDAFYNQRGELLRTARERLADVPGQVPLPADLASYGIRLDAAAARFRAGKLSDYARALDRHGHGPGARSSDGSTTRGASSSARARRLQRRPRAGSTGRRRT